MSETGYTRHGLLGSVATNAYCYCIIQGVKVSTMAGYLLNGQVKVIAFSLVKTPETVAKAI
jgi:hypothetical protein